MDDRDEILREARLRYPVGTVVRSDGRVMTLDQDLYWQYTNTLSAIGFPVVWHTDDGWRELDVISTPLTSNKLINNYEIC